MKKVLSLLFVVIVLMFVIVACNDDAPTTTTTNHEHVLAVDEAVESTCEKTGLTFGVHCSECGEIIVAQEKTPPKHTEEIDAAVAPTCTATGLTEGKHCLECGLVIDAQETVPVIECIESDWILDREATKTEDGFRHTACTMCGKIIATDVLPRSGYTITLWVPSMTGFKELTQTQVEAFMQLHPEYDFEIKIEIVDIGDTAIHVLKDVSTAPDMYCFAQDQIARLVQGGALAPLGAQVAETVKNNNDSASVDAATVGSSIYAYPLTSDNGYFLYYDSRYISDEQAKTWEGIIAACKAADKKVGCSLTNAWMMSGFFLAQPVGGGVPLCTSTWTYSNDGVYPIAVNDNFNSANGLIAMKEMNELANSGVWVNSDWDFTGTAAIVTGIWCANNAEAEYGDNVKATKLPTFVGSDGNIYQMGSFFGCKLLGCKPQTDVKKAEICNALALYLTSGEAQLDRYYEFQWGPSNLEAQANQDVQENILLAALLQQNVYGITQRAFPGEWWEEAAVLGTLAAEADKTEADFQKALEDYEAKINALIERYN